MFTSPNRDPVTYAKALEMTRERAVDAAFQRYLDWRQESSTCASAYERWATAVVQDRCLAFASYTAALDREQQAAAQYQSACFGSSRHCGS